MLLSCFDYLGSFKEGKKSEQSKNHVVLESEIGYHEWLPKGADAWTFEGVGIHQAYDGKRQVEKGI